MKPCMPLVAMLFASATFPLLAQQPTSPDQPGNPGGQPSAQQNPSSPQSPSQTSPSTQNSPASQSTAATSADTSAAPTSAGPMSPVNGELVSKLDSKTAKAGDNVIVETKTAVKTDNGTQVPEGSKLVGHVLAVQPSGQGANSQLVLQFDHVELKGGQSLPVHSQIESIGSAQNTASSPEAMSAPQAGSADRSPSQNSMSPNTSGASSSSPSASGSPTASGTSSASGASGSNTAGADSRTSPVAGNTPPAGTVVAKNGNIAIQTTSIPGVLLANNAPGQSDPRMARASSILLGVKKDIELDSGTQVVVDVAPTNTGTATH